MVLERFKGFMHSFVKDESITPILPDTQEVAHRSELAKLAAEVFAKASVDYPASVPAQSAKIALLLKERGIEQSPLELMDALLNDEQELRLVILAGDSRHHHAGNGPKDKDGNLISIDPLRARFVIGGDFRWAGLISNLDAGDIEDILASYAHFKDQFREFAGSEVVDDLVEQEIATKIIERLGPERYAAFLDESDEADKAYFAEYRIVSMDYV